MPAQTADELKLVTERVISRKRKKPREKPIADPGSSDPEQKVFIETVEDLLKHSDIETVHASLMARFRQAAEIRRSFEEEWYFSVRAWFQQPTEPREDSWESDRYLPIILKHTETALPAIVAAVLSKKGMWRMVGMTREGKNAAKALERLQNFQTDSYEFLEEYEDMFWWSALIGTGYLDHGWNREYDERTVPIVVDDPDAPGGKRKDFERNEIKVEDQPWVQALNPLDVYPGPGVQMGDAGPWFFERVETTIGELRELAKPQGENDRPHISDEALEHWIRDDKPGDQPMDQNSWVEEIAGATWSEWLLELGYDKEGDEDTTLDKLSDEKRVVVLKYRSEAEQVTLAGPNRIIGYSRNKDIHGRTGIVVHHFFKVPNCPFGRGIGGILQGHQELGNENINRWMDAVVIEAMAPIVVDKSRANLLDDELVLQPNAIIRTRGVDAVQRMQLPAPTSIAMTMDGHLNKDADELTGFTEQARGVAPGANQTATAFQGIQSNLLTRLVTHVNRSERTLRRSGRLIAKLNQQYYTEAQIVQFVGEDGLDYVEIQPWEIVGDMVVGVHTSASRATPEMRAQRIMQMLQILVPLIQGGALQQPQVRRLVRMAMEANEIEDVDLLIPKGGEKIKDAGVENVMLEKLIPVAVNPGEPHDVHNATHGELLQRLATEGASQQKIELVTAHMLEHSQHQAAAAQAEQQKAQDGQGTPEQQAQGASGAGVGPSDGSPARQEATAAAALTGGQGTPGVAAPGPAGPGQQG